MIIVLTLTGYLQGNKREAGDVSYIETGKEPKSVVVSDSRPFSSTHGKTYTFSWCQGSTRTQVKNRVYYESEAGAIAAGKTLSKLCSR